MSLGLPARHWKKPVRSGWIELSGTLRYVVIDALFLFEYETDESDQPCGSFCLAQSSCSLTAGADCGRQAKFAVLLKDLPNKETLFLVLDTEEEQVLWLSALESQQRNRHTTVNLKRPDSPDQGREQPAKSSPPSKSSKRLKEKESKGEKAKEKVERSTSGTKVAKLDKKDVKAYEEIAAESSGSNLQHLTKARARPPRKARPTRQLLQEHAEKADESKFDDKIEEDSDPEDVYPVRANSPPYQQSPSSSPRTADPSPVASDMSRSPQNGQGDSLPKKLKKILSEPKLNLEETHRALSASPSTESVNSRHGDRDSLQNSPLDQATMKSDLVAMAAEASAVLPGDEEVKKALSQAYEILRLAFVARVEAEKELEDARKQRREAEHAKKQAMELLRLAREAVQTLK